MSAPLKILLVAAFLAAALAVAKEASLFEKTGVVGSCEVVQSPTGDTSVWHACREGMLTGYPSLVRDSCTFESRRAGYEYWRCPAPLERGPLGS